MKKQEAITFMEVGSKEDEESFNELMAAAEAFGEFKYAMKRKYRR